MKYLEDVFDENFTLRDLLGADTTLGEIIDVFYNEGRPGVTINLDGYDEELDQRPNYYFLDKLEYVLPGDYDNEHPVTLAEYKIFVTETNNVTHENYAPKNLTAVYQAIKRYYQKSKEKGFKVIEVDHENLDFNSHQTLVYMFESADKFKFNDSFVYEQDRISNLTKKTLSSFKIEIE